MKCCLLLVLTLFSGQIWCQRSFRQERQQLCTTPENYYGICVRLTQCPSIVNYYGQSRGSQQAVQYLYQVQRACGTRSVANDPVICCEEAYNNYYRPQQTTPRPQNPFTQFPTQPPPPPTQPPTRPPPPATQPPTRPPPPATQPPPPPTQPPTPPPVNNRASDCRGPDQRPGNCVDVRDCQELLNALIYDSQNATVGSFLRLSNEICRNNGYVAGTSVCCPNGERVTFPQTTAKPRSNGNGKVSLNGQECGLSTVFQFRRVVGGQAAKLGTWPWITLLGYDVLEGSPFKCGGTLITERHVLTAAHCIRSDLKFVRLGEHDLGKTTETTTVDINISKMDRHPQYNSRNGKNDLAVLHLESPVSYTDLIHPACLPKNEPLRSKSFVDFQPFVAGWGRTQEGGKSAEILQELQLPVLSNQVCHDRYASQRRLVTEDQFDNAVICAGVLTGGMDTCQGDSGGPLMYPEQTAQDFRFYVIGVVSYGVGCARAEIPGVYTNVANFIDWIEEKIAV